jgi:hypothetical protein
MGRQINETLWRQLTQEVMTGLREWRLQYPQATLRESETEPDTRLNHMRARLLEDLALQSAATDLPRLRRAAPESRQSTPHPPNPQRSGHYAGAPPRRLPGLADRAFPPGS